MGKSILFKLWITFFFALALALSAMLFFTHWSMQKGFIDYITDRSVKRLTTLEQSLIEIHRQQGSWGIVGRRPGLWNKLRHQAIMSQIDGDDRDNRDYRRYLEHFFEPLILADADHQKIAGVPAERHYHWHGVMDGERLLGYIGYIKPHRLIRTVDRLFVERQIRIYLLGSVVCLLLSSLVAWLLSRRFVKPIRRLSSGARALAAGDYNLRIEARSDDELGRLCHHFNELARTLEANEQSRRQWVADISHEMRTPLAVMKAQIEALQDGIRAPSAENLALVHNKVNALSRLIDDLYELSLSDLGALSYHKEPLALSEVLQECLEDYEPKFAAADLHLEADIQLGRRDLIYGDSERLIQLFHNLMENSCRYTRSPGKVRLSARRQSGEFIIAFEDSAPGVDSEQTELIFDRLYRLETSRNRSTGGAGLGLSICKNIVVAHEGRIKAEESSLGGLRILIHFPVLRP